MTEVSTALATVTGGTGECRHQGSPLSLFLSLSHSQPLSLTHTHTRQRFLPTSPPTFCHGSEPAGRDTHGGQCLEQAGRVRSVSCVVCAHVHETTFAYDRAARPAKKNLNCLPLPRKEEVKGKKRKRVSQLLF